MSIRYRFDGPVLRFHVEGIYKWREARDVLEAAMDESRFRDGRTLLMVDARESRYQPTHVELLEVARYMPKLARRTAGIAVLVTDPLHRSLAHMLAAMVRLRDVEVDILEREEELHAWAAERAATTPRTDPKTRSRQG